MRKKRSTTKSIVRFSAFMVGILALSFLLTSPPALSQSRGQSAPKIYCWETPTGRECGDTVPAEAAGASRDEFSPRTGTKINHVQRAKTPEEIAQEKWEREVQMRRQAEQDRTEREITNVRMRYDSVDAIRQDFSDRRQSLEVGLTLAKDSARSAHLAFISSLDNVAGLEMDGKAISDNAFKRVVDRHQEWKERRAGVEMSEARIADLDEQMELSVQMWMGTSNSGAAATLP